MITIDQSAPLWAHLMVVQINQVFASIRPDNAVAITGGTINGTSVGATTPAAGSFTTLGASGLITALSGTAATAGGARAITLGSGSVGIFWGSGVPTITAGQGSLYLRTDGSSTSTRAYINTDGATTWTSVTTAA